MMPACPTEAARAALKWLRDHGGTGVYDNNGVLLAAGERAPFMRSSWNNLREFGLVRQGPARRRVTVTETGLAFEVGATKKRTSVELNRGEIEEEDE